MIDFPSITVGDIQKMADWVELCALVDARGLMSQADLDRFLQSAGQVGYSKDELFPEDESYLDSLTFSEDEGAERLAEIIWQELQGRALVLADAYPFDLSGDCIVRRMESWRDVPAFTMLLVSDMSRSYGADVHIEPDTQSSRLFEKIVEACKRGLLGGTSVRFGTPIEPGWPTPINERISILGEKLSLDVENLAGKTRPRDNDRGLDVVGRLSFGDDGPGGLVLLTQCATGRNWKRKRGEPSIADWKDIFRWDANLLRAVAVPWRLEQPFDYARTHRYFDAIVLDRPRLVAGAPDQFLDKAVKDQIVSWCEEQILKLPQSK